MSTTGIVVVSHSARLAEAALELAEQMVPGGSVPIRLAAGAGTDPDGAPILGTDATRVAEAIDDLADLCDGVLVLMDLGSAVMSAEFALELRMSDVPVRLSSAPFVEGLLAASVTAAQGAPLAEVAAEAAGALIAKSAQLGEEDASAQVGAEAADAKCAGAEGDAAPPAGTTTPAERSGAASAGGAATRVVRVRNPAGMHARPAALIAQAAQGAELTLRRLPEGDPVPASSMMRLLAFGARQGDEIELRGDPEALDRIAALFDDGFGEMSEPSPAEDGFSGTSSGQGFSSAPVGGGFAATSGEDARAISPAPVSVLPGSTLHGLGVSPGRAIAPVALLGAAIAAPDAAARVEPDDRDAEAARIAVAASQVVSTLRERAQSLDPSQGAAGEAAQILLATAQLAADPDLAEGAAARVRASGATAARAVWDEAEAQQRMLRGLGGRMAERVADVRSVRDRIVARLSGQEVPGIPDRDEPFVLVAEDLAPAETATLGRSSCVALVTQEGGPTSHTAILARALGIPAVVGVPGATGIAAGTIVLVDGTAGSVRLDPTAEETAAPAEDVPAFDGRGVLADGTEVALLANVGGEADAMAAAAAHAQGVGLFRTEFCFLDRTEEPAVAEQVAAYRGVLAPFAGRKVVVRTLDAGSDKPLPFAVATAEENPALGVRGLRVARVHPTLLAHQLAAIAQAAAAESALVEVMAPMVATIDEARDFVAACRAAGIGRAGIMIETPAAALMAADLLAVVDFVSLGTNDLAQYTMAADRLSAPLGALNDPWQPAVLRLIALVGEAGRAAGKPVGVCGEAGGDPALAPVLLGLGVTSLSMTARSLARVSARIRTVTAADCRRAASAAASSATADEARAAVAAALG